jgi:hypothetical protein
MGIAPLKSPFKNYWSIFLSARGEPERVSSIVLSVPVTVIITIPNGFGLHPALCRDIEHTAEDGMFPKLPGNSKGHKEIRVTAVSTFIREVINA